MTDPAMKDDLVTRAEAWAANVARLMKLNRAAFRKRLAETRRALSHGERE